MKLMHTTTTLLNTREFNKLSERIINALYALNSDIKDLYDIHINYIEDSWRIDFLPRKGMPVIKVDTYTEYGTSGYEILRVIPKNLTDFPDSLSFKQNTAFSLCENYISIFEFIQNLYDFEYALN